MEQAHDTIEAQNHLKRQGLMVCGLIILALGIWLLIHAFSAPSHETHETASHQAGQEHASTQTEDGHTKQGHTDEKAAETEHEHHASAAEVPAFYSVLPFVALLLCIAVLPLSSKTEHWWESNLNRFMVAAGLGLITLFYYAFLYGHGVENHLVHGISKPGLPAAGVVFVNAMLVEYIPFITLLFSLYVISGGIVIESRLMGTPAINAAIIATGALLASFVGTTGAAMLLIRPLLVANVKRSHVAHTVIFFIFAVCNTGGCLLPIGDPPLFLGYLRGVPFLWTLKLWPMWLFANLLIVATYFVWDTIVSKKEEADAFTTDGETESSFRMLGKFNLLLLAGIILCVATLVPGNPLPGTSWIIPLYFREFLMFVITVCSLYFTTSEIRLKNAFNYDAILEVAALFCGIFICMQAPVQILNVYGSQLGLDTPTKFFWCTGFLSSFLDNAPTYVVFFETAKTLDPVGTTVAHVSETYLIAISLGAVFMGAMTYIGNGPNFMVKAIAEKNNIRMPSFFGYILYSVAVLVPVFLLTTFVFL